MYVESCMILVVSRPFVVLDGLPGLYGLKYDSATAYGLLLYLYSYKLVGSATTPETFTWVGGGASPRHVNATGQKRRPLP